MQYSQSTQPENDSLYASPDDEFIPGKQGAYDLSTIRVSSKSRTTAVAGAIAGMIREHNCAEVQAIGAGAVNQAVKALAIARSYLRRDDIDVIFLSYFTAVIIRGEERTAIRFRVEPQEVVTTQA